MFLAGRISALKGSLYIIAQVSIRRGTKSPAKCAFVTLPSVMIGFSHLRARRIRLRFSEDRTKGLEQRLKYDDKPAFTH